jgi:hypothetical protein
VAKTHDNFVGNCMSNLLPLEDKDRAGTETTLNDFGRFKTQSSIDNQSNDDG